MIKTLLCYGDSNTWGYIPESGQRYTYQLRWPGIVQHALGQSYMVIEEGLNGRTTMWNDPFKPGRNGLKAILPVLQSHAPIDLVVLMLGTNDLKHYHNVEAADVARGVAKIIKIIQKSDTGPEHHAPKILLISPPEITAPSPDLSMQFRGAEVKSREFSPHFQVVAEVAGSLFLDAAKITPPAVSEGIHLDMQGHQRLGEAVVNIVLNAVS